jgi:hypothetical protein
MDSIIVFVLQALFACIFFSACTSVANGRLIALSEEPFPFMPNRVDVLTGVRARLVGLGLILHSGVENGEEIKTSINGERFSSSYGFAYDVLRITIRATRT